MLFRNTEGLLIEINKSSYKNDHLYYKKISEIKELNSNSNSNTAITNTNANTPKYSTQAIDKVLSHF